MKKILIVEDESLVSQHIKSVLWNSGFKVSGIADNVEEAFALIEEHHPDLVLIDIQLKGDLNGIDLARSLTSKNLPFVFLTANFEGKLLEQAKETLPLGFIVKPFREYDLLTTLDVAFYRHEHMMDSRYKNEQELNIKLKKITDESGDLKALLLKIAEAIQHHVPFDYLNIVKINTATSGEDHAGLLRIGFEEYQYIEDGGFTNITGYTSNEIQNDLNSRNTYKKPRIFKEAEFSNLLRGNTRSQLISDIYNIQSAFFFPMDTGEPVVTRLEFYNRRPNIYTIQHAVLLTRTQATLANLFTDTVNGKDHQALNGKLQTITTINFDGMVGQSPEMLSVLDKIEIVAPLDTSVLILGESGTGKERIARSIHQRSNRRDRPLTVVNCASLPVNLVETELFGHEKGAFTGAVERRLGKFEIADGGTIFLDEIGELSVDIQVKFLRVLQEQEIDRIGGRSPIKIDVRIIAATNRKLEAEMEAGHFRLDLYYRLFVFPITIPPLRDRPGDIVALTEYFVDRYAKKYKKAISGVSKELMDRMSTYPWPGNVRELEHFIERSVLLTRGMLITDAELPQQVKPTAPGPTSRPVLKTIDENERDYILAVLENCHGRIRGAKGAAEIMGLPPTTLHSKMKRLGIR
ncbi:sigma 54-interacting transcriptional regulator [Mucilaginibacter sp. SMC90]|uniref:sigma 54-interacting transcriptional regulator n=1 Tax=Mucilaginibacter sp. SMC90 TaxID=2929803 RepID=UPI001FB2E713|nr:sigma 54-interacting transcriptional regulator [Mucilaginibacter sp. SMC90]UOE48825.1 sigma 54-interacting transcriptional regulator [Mucilaginibacter sp. SMC90]